MKKIIAVLLLISLLISCCACGTDPMPQADETLPSAQQGGSEEIQIPEISETDPYADINEFEPNDEGIYQIYSVEGLMNIYNHLDGSFVLLQDIDLQGAKWTPVGTQDAPFTGTFNGRSGGVQYSVKNFVIDTPTADGDMGFFGVNAGDLRNVSLADMTITANADTQRVGSLAGTNSGTLLRCSASGTITVTECAEDNACGGVVGLNSGELNTTEVSVAVQHTAAGKANVGGLVGILPQGVIRDVSTTGALVVTGGADKKVGLFIGSAKNLDANVMKFVGADNRVDGELYTEFYGEQENIIAAECLWRDNSAEPLPENIQALREKVVEVMRTMGSVEWTVSQSMGGDCYCTNSLGSCRKLYVAGTTYRGLPYQHKAGNLARFMYCLDENNVVKDWVYELEGPDGHDSYMGSDCSSSVQHAWVSIANSMDVSGTGFMLPDKNTGTLPVGDYVWQLPDGVTSYYTTDYRDATGEEGVYESLAKCRMGDGIVAYTDAGGHARMVAQDALVMRNEEGKIDPQASFLVIHEQGHLSSGEGWESTWTLNGVHSFAELYETAYLPVTIKELVTGETETPVATLEDGMDGKAGLTAGTVVSNWFLNSVSMVITDSTGEEVINHEMFVTVGRYEDYNNWSPVRDLEKEFSLAHFAQALQGTYFDPAEEYHCVITAHLGNGDEIVVKDYSF